MKKELLFAALVAADVAAQTPTFIVPSRIDRLGTSTATNPGGSVNLDVFRPGTHPARVQYLWPVRDVPVPSAFLTGMELRRSSTWWPANPAATATVALDLSVGPNPPHSQIVTFARNRGGFVLNVFHGTLNLPAAVRTPGVAPFVVALPFTQPFPYSATLGVSLVAELVVTAYAPVTQESWVLDAVGRDVGRFTPNHSVTTCRFSNGAFADYVSIIGPELGQTFYRGYGGFWTTPIPSRLPAIGLLGFHGRNGIWNGVPLPLDLGSAGAPGCALATSIAIAVPLLENAPGIYEWPTFAIPADPTLYDGSFFDQGLFVEPAANALGLVLSNSMRFTVRSGDLPMRSRLVQWTVNGVPTPNPTDGAFGEEVAVARFNY